MAAVVANDLARTRIVAASALVGIPVVLFFVPWLYVRFRSGRGTPLPLDLAMAAVLAGIVDRVVTQMRHGDLGRNPFDFLIDVRFLLMAAPISIALCAALMHLLRGKRWGGAVALLIGVGIAVAVAQWWDPITFVKN